MKKIFWLAIISAMSSTAMANWSLNLGYQNPAFSKYGVNFLNWGSKWMFEIGVGYIEAKAKDDDEIVNEEEKNTSATVGGDFDLKYILSSGGITPFVQVGAGYGAHASDEEAGVGTGSAFAGIGLFGGGQSAYLYGSFNVNLSHTDHSFVQAGVGFDI